MPLVSTLSQPRGCAPTDNALVSARSSDVGLWPQAADPVCPLDVRSLGVKRKSPKAIPARLPPLSPPKRLFEFVRDVAPGDADIVQVALGPACELPAIAITLPPEMKGVHEHRRQPLCRLAGQLLVEADESLDISGDQACKFHSFISLISLGALYRCAADSVLSAGVSISGPRNGSMPRLWLAITSRHVFLGSPVLALFGHGATSDLGPLCAPH
jgi:hypothetical protein